jgi:hypothetical protein
MKRRSDRIWATLLGSLLAIPYFLSFLVVPGSASAQARLEVTREKDKTVYTIGSGPQAAQEEALEKERAWEMLKNMRIDADRRKSQPHTQEQDGASRSGQPAESPKTE